MAVSLLARTRERAQLPELVVVEARLLDAVGRHLLLDCPAVGEGTDRDVLPSPVALEHLTGTVESEVVGDDQALHHRLAQPPGSLDQALVGPVHRVLREHDAGALGIEQ